MVTALRCLFVTTQSHADHSRASNSSLIDNRYLTDRLLCQRFPLPSAGSDSSHIPHSFTIRRPQTVQLTSLRHHVQHQHWYVWTHATALFTKCRTEVLLMRLLCRLRTTVSGSIETLFDWHSVGLLCCPFSTETIKNGTSSFIFKIEILIEGQSHRDVVIPLLGEGQRDRHPLVRKTGTWWAWRKTG